GVPRGPAAGRRSGLGPHRGPAEARRRRGEASAVDAGARARRVRRRGRRAQAAPRDPRVGADRVPERGPRARVRAVRAARARSRGGGRLRGGGPPSCSDLRAQRDAAGGRRVRSNQDPAGRLGAAFPGGLRSPHPLPPPLLRALGLKEKLKLGPWFASVFGVLARMKWLRGTPLDPFGYAAVRCVERQLPGEYRALVEKALVGPSPESYEPAVKVATLPDLIRGYEEIKLRNIQRFRDEVRALGF